MFNEIKKPKSYQGSLPKQNMIAHGTNFEGDIKSEGDFRIEGTVKGTLITKGKVVIGSTGEVEGNLTCKNADIEGVVKGGLIVLDLLSLRASAHIEGDVQTGKLAVEPGATFNAHCQMKGSVKELKTDNKSTNPTSAKPEQSA